MPTFSAIIHIKKVKSGVSLDFVPIFEEVDHLLLNVLVGGLRHLHLFEVEVFQYENEFQLLLLDFNFIQ